MMTSRQYEGIKFGSFSQDDLTLNDSEAPQHQRALLWIGKRETGLTRVLFIILKKEWLVKTSKKRKKNNDSA